MSIGAAIGFTKRPSYDSRERLVGVISCGGRSVPTGSGVPVRFRRFDEGDSVYELTRLLHRAYSDHAVAGRVFFASYQSAKDTAIRSGRGECWLALRGTALAGTVTLAVPYQAPKGYPAPAGAGSFWQLAVDPAHRRTGLGQRLLTLAEDRITALGATAAVIDTSAEAAELLGWYRRRGYRPVGKWRWDVTNYESVVLHKDLAGAERMR
ncbi:GNAT family N-acetyltransferase [Kitasatospora sp. NPDC059795]|uniref:GNAT family N-acetyltransferase n=1 Tax=Kitasatospora sp. NPDC059795 TaxID=3346949 RepID=UPI00365C0F86